MRGILLYDLDLPDSESWVRQIQDALKNTKDISSFEELQQVIKDKKRTGLSAFRIPAYYRKRRQRIRKVLWFPGKEIYRKFYVIRLLT